MILNGQEDGQIEMKSLAAMAHDGMLRLTFDRTFVNIVSIKDNSMHYWAKTSAVAQGICWGYCYNAIIRGYKFVC